VPAHRPPDLFRPDRKHGIQLYSRRVFIMDDCRDIVPEYLRFLRGVVDAAELNLNVSREILQEDRTVRAIRKTLVRKVLDHFTELDAETFAAFQKEFGIVLKEGVHSDPENRDRLAKLLRYPTTASEGKLLSLDDYVKNMKDGQEHIYYLTGDNPASLADNPHLERLRSLGYEVLLMSDAVDEFVVSALTEYEGKKLHSAEKGDLGIAPAEETKQKTKENEGLLAFLKTALGERVRDVRASDRLTGSAACLSSEEGDVSALMAKMLKSAGHGVPDERRILEVNLDHPLVARLHALHEQNSADPSLSEHAELLFDLALVGEGGKLPNPAAFARRIGELAAKAL
jgi:molecular chaperone HtpG